MRIRPLTVLAILVPALLVGWAFLRTGASVPALLVYEHQPIGVMGTSCDLVLVSSRHRESNPQRDLLSAEAELRRLEALLSTWIAASPISRFNGSQADQPIALPPELVEVLVVAQGLFKETHGAFDITARPLIEVWRRAGDHGHLPTLAALAAARSESDWNQIRLAGARVSKSMASTRVDIDGIAKGYAIDRALEVLQRSGAQGGMVEIGGDLRVFGEGPEAKPWTVAIRSPFDEGPWAEIALSEGAVCSSGDYARFSEIDGQRFGHIIDPRSGRPTEETRAVTVVGPDAATADAWATALSVLGVEGFELLPNDRLEAMVVTGSPDNYEVELTPGFRRLLVRAAFDLTE